jgi:hypothetical protein
MSLHRLAGALLATLAIGCAEEPVTRDPGLIQDQPDAASADDAAPDPGCKLRLGSGVREFQPVNDGDTLFLYKGPQGGYMIYLSVQALGFDPARVNLCYVEKISSTGNVFGDKCWLVKLTNDLGNGWYERVGVWGEVSSEYWTSPGKIRGHTVDVVATLSDEQGCTATADFQVFISEDPGR